MNPQGAMGLGGGAGTSSIALFDGLASHYDDHFLVPHRSAYDELAWERVVELLPTAPGRIIDAGCGSGRWAARICSRGHRLLGIEAASAMVALARRRGLGDAFTIIEGSMELVDLPEGSADLVLAMGSVQYTEDPARTIRRLATWAKPGGWVCILVDSLVALVVELLRSGRQDEAARRMATRIGTFSQVGLEADHHLIDRTELEGLLVGGGLADVTVAGLIVSATIVGTERFSERLRLDHDRQMAHERELMQEPLLADLGKHLLATGRRPA
jgi:SAM-dependent methyltransferase